MTEGMDPVLQVPSAGRTDRFTRSDRLLSDLVNQPFCDFAFMRNARRFFT